MMNLYLDCEWNEFGGDLISVALVGEDGREFYECLPCPSPGAWVAQHVIPVLGRQPVDYGRFQQSLFAFLQRYTDVTIIADWPEDIAKFCGALILGPGQRMDTPELMFRVIRVDAPSDVPHNALHDARGIMRALTEKAA